jgi:hypothetical protein
MLSQKTKLGKKWIPFPLPFLANQRLSNGLFHEKKFLGKGRAKWRRRMIMMMMMMDNDDDNNDNDGVRSHNHP